jgi:hypothetical protein
MMKLMVLLLAVLSFFLGLQNSAQATLWTGHYEVNLTLTSLGENSYHFDYALTNLDQQGGSHWGLDGFYVQVPVNAILSNLTDPTPGSGAGVWTHTLGTVPSPEHYGSTATLTSSSYQWLQWWGHELGSVYPVGTTAHFGFDACGVGLTVNQGAAVTNMEVGPWYAGFEGPIQGPAPVPLPGTALLLSSGLLLAAGGRRFCMSR